MTADTEPVDVVVVGAGLGGLTAAVALQGSGADVHVYEREPRIAEVGAGIHLASNATTALREIGILDELLPRVQIVRTLENRTWSGKPLRRTDIGAMSDELGSPMIATHRAVIQRTLANAVDPRRLHLGHEFTQFEPADDGLVTARFGNGHAVRTRLLVGADGIWSRVRSQLHGQDEPVRYAGYSCWRGLTSYLPPGIELDNSLSFVGVGRRFSYVVIGDGQLYWKAIVNGPEGEREEPKETKRLLAGMYTDWAEPVEAVIDATDVNAILKHDLYDREPLERWGRGEVTLLGDAAHPMTPNLGQGACQAIEDGVVLGQLFAAGAASDLAARYEDQRVSRTSRAVYASRATGEEAQSMQDPAEEALPHYMSRLTTREVLTFPSVASR